MNAIRYLPWRKEGRGICGGRGGRDGVAIGMEGNGGGRDGEWREGARKAEKGTRMKHAALASCGGGEGRAKWTWFGKAFRLAAGRRLSA